MCVFIVENQFLLTYVHAPMLRRVQERRGHNAAIYRLVSTSEGFLSTAADGYLVHWHRDEVDLGHLRATVPGGKFLSLLDLGDGLRVAGTLAGSVHWLPEGDEDRARHLQHHRRGVFDLLRVGADTVYSAGGDGVLTQWTTDGQRPVESRSVSGNSLRCLAFNPFRNRLAIGASDGNIHLLDRGTASLLKPAPAHSPSVFTLAYGPAGEYLYSGGRDARLTRWRVTDDGLEAERDVEAHLATVNALALHPDGKLLATASRDKTVKLWRADGLELLKVCEPIRDRGHVNSVNCLAWLDAETLVTAGDDRRILEWKLG